MNTDIGVVVPCRREPRDGDQRHHASVPPRGRPMQGLPARPRTHPSRDGHTRPWQTARTARQPPRPQCLRRVGPPALRPGSGLRRPGLLALDLGTPGSPAGGSPVTHQRPPDRAARVQVVPFRFLVVWMLFQTAGLAGCGFRSFAVGWPWTSSRPVFPGRLSGDLWFGSDREGDDRGVRWRGQDRCP